LEDTATALAAGSFGYSDPLNVALAAMRALFSADATMTATGLTYKILTSTDLVKWSEDTGASASQVAGAVTNANQSVLVTLTGSLPLAVPRLFVRVAAQSSRQE